MDLRRLVRLIFYVHVQNIERTAATGQLNMVRRKTEAARANVLKAQAGLQDAIQAAAAMQATEQVAVLEHDRRLTEIDQREQQCNALHKRWHEMVQQQGPEAERSEQGEATQEMGGGVAVVQKLMCSCV